MCSGKHMKLDVVRVLTKTRWKALRDRGREVFILGARDMQYRGCDGMIFVLFPVLRHAAANRDHAARFFRMGSDETIIQTDGLRKAHEHGAWRGDGESAAQLHRDRANDIVMQPDIQFRMLARSPV